MKKSLYFLPLMAMVFTGCLSEDEEPDYVEWKKQNEEYVTKMEELTENGEKVYTKVVPEWAPSLFPSKGSVSWMAGSAVGITNYLVEEY